MIFSIEGIAIEGGMFFVAFCNSNVKGESILKVLFDLSPAQPRGSILINGSGTYSYHLFKNLFDSIGCGDELVAIMDGTLDEHADAGDFCRLHGIRIEHYSDIDDFSRIIGVERGDVLVLPTCFSYYWSLKVPDETRIISIIHDLCWVFDGTIDVKYGRYLKKDGLNFLRVARDKVKAQKRSAKEIEMHNKVIRLNNNQVLVTVSYFSKSTFQHFLDLESYDINDIKVFYSPEREFVQGEVMDCAGTLNKYGLEKARYFLFSSGCRWAKNNAIAIFTLDKMFSSAKYKRLLKGFRVMITGVDELYKNYYLEHIENKERFKFVGYISDMEMATLYQCAHIFVFPSILEGFGLPPTEAMKYGTVSAVSTAMSMTEVCGDAAIYFDPHSETDIEMALVRSLDREYLTQKRRLSLERYEELQRIREKGMNDLIALILGV